MSIILSADVSGEISCLPNSLESIPPWQSVYYALVSSKHGELMAVTSGDMRCLPILSKVGALIP